ncbi:MAG: STAS domain-containing protein [Pseudomonadota bacterium]
MTSENHTAPALSVLSEDYADCRLVRVSGRIDHTNSDGFLNDLSRMAEGVANGGGMVVDLGQLEFITSAGLRALLLAQKTLTAAGARLVVTQIKGVVQEVFRISKFDAILSVAETTDEAVAQISPQAAEAYSG